MKNRIFKNMEWWILISAILLCIVGFFALHSAIQAANLDYLKRQIIWFSISIVVMFVIIFIEYDLFIKVSPILYGLSIVLLIGVLFTGYINGARSWFIIGPLSFQPGEISKISCILFTAWLINKIQERGKNEINNFWKLLLVLVANAVPILLIVIQPDYGTAAAYVFALVLMLFVSGINKRYIISAIIIIVVSMPLIYMYILPQHAKKRIETFLNPELDPRGAGYNVIQSKMAIGAGELTGMGLLNGNQTQLGYLSPKTTDFIYSVIGEEMGFVVAGSVIIIYVILITKSLYVAKTAKDDLGSLICAGISGVFLFHMTENIGMTMGLLPITGVPLLFVSYGGTSLMTSFVCIGLLLNISGRRKKTIFIE